MIHPYYTVVEIKGGVVLIDNEDIPKIEGFYWHSQRGYAITRKMKDGSRTSLYMHRLIMDADHSDVVDHKNHNTLDNRRRNLRITTYSCNSGNSKINSRNTSGYKGVTFFKDRRLYGASVTVQGQRHYLGFFDNPLEAAKAYDIAALSKFGEFALTNKALGRY